MRRAWLLVALTACGRLGFDGIGPSDATPEAPPEWTSGSRLRAVITEADGGSAPLVARWFDTQLDLECRFDRASDGTWRCLPIAGGAPSWSDAGCTQPILELTEPYTLAECGAPRYVRPGNQAAVYELGAPWTGEVYRVNGGDPCFHYTGGTTLAHFARGTEIPPSAFVRADEEVSPFHRLSHVSLVGEDGSRQRLAELHDAQLDMRCRVTELDTGRGWCLPAEVATASRQWSDAGCTQPALLATSAASIVYVSTRGACTFTSQLFATGAELASTYYRLDAGVCTPSTAPAGWHVYALGAEVDRDTYASFAASLSDPGARVGMLLWERDDAMRVSQDIRFDRTRDVPCFPAADPISNQHVCAPSLESAAAYTDAGCTASAGFTSCSAGGAMYFPSGELPFSTCDAVRLEFKPADPIPVAGPLWQRTDAGCEPLDASVKVYPVNVSGPSLDVTAMPALMTRRE